MSREMHGIMMGIVGDGEKQGIAIGFAGGQTLAMSVDQAGFIFNQLGDLLDALGYFEDDEVDPKNTKH